MMLRLSELSVLLPLTHRGQNRSRDFARITVDGDPVVLAADHSSPRLCAASHRVKKIRHYPSDAFFRPRRWVGGNVPEPVAAIDVATSNIAPLLLY
jgi:hypothetical protein